MLKKIIKVFSSIMRIFRIERPKIYCTKCKQNVIVGNYCNKDCPQFPSTEPDSLI